MDKKGNAAGVMVMTSLVLGVAVASIVLLFTSILGGSTYNLVEPDILALGDYDVTAESFAGSNNTAAQLNNGYIQEGTLEIYNGSGDIGIGNFTIDYTLGTILVNGARGLNVSDLFANYTYGQAEVRAYILGAAASGFEAQENAGNYLPIVVLAVIIVLIFTIMFGSVFGRVAGGGAL